MIESKLKLKVTDILKKYKSDSYQLLSILIEIQNHFRHIPPVCIPWIADELDVTPLHIEGTLSFYHFLSTEHRGKITIYMNNSITSEMFGGNEVLKTFENELGISVSQTTPDGLFGLYTTSCIGMSDQEPAALINNLVFTHLSPERVKKIIAGIKKGLSLNSIQESIYISETKSATHCENNEILKNKIKEKTLPPPPLSNISNSIHKKGPVLFADYHLGATLHELLKYDSTEVIEIISKSGLRGRGGAGFPTGTKWGYAHSTASDERYVICNADEGEPGTFKDRALLTERAELIFEGMIVAGYAIESKKGILYLRGEYTYLKEFLQSKLKSMREQNLLGRRILNSRFSFDIQIKMGAGAYICGEESALIESAEGKRGEPRNRPPFPVTSGYKNRPTVVNNPETLACAAKIILHGAEWFKKLGTPQSSGVKLLSIAGDCERPGIYEVEWGLSIKEILQLCGAQDTMIIQVGGPSGICLSLQQADQTLCYSDVPTGGAITIFNSKRNLLELLKNNLNFFVHESCGFCVPCRAGNTLLYNQLQKIKMGHGTVKDLEDLRHLSSIVKSTSRCGLGQSSTNTLVSSLNNFPSQFEKIIERKSTTQC